MAGRLLLQAFILLLPFLVFGLYVLATRSAEDAGKRKWPIQILFVTGLALTTLVWFGAILLEPRERDMCVEPARYENGQIVPARTYPCERRPQDVGVPSSRGQKASEGASAPATPDDPS